LLDVVLEDPDIMEAIRTAIPWGVSAGIEARAESTNYPDFGPGILAYINSVRHLGDLLNLKGFVKDAVNNQTRFLGPERKGHVRVRIIVCRGEELGRTALVNVKGAETQKLVDENRPFNPQLALPYAEIDQLARDARRLESSLLRDEADPETLPVLNVWVFTDLDNSRMLKVWIGVVGSMNSGATELSLWDQETIHTEDMGTYGVPTPAMDRPESVVNAVIMTEKKRSAENGRD
jgi:hypothetical protein